MNLAPQQSFPALPILARLHDCASLQSFPGRFQFFPWLAEAWMTPAEAALAYEPTGSANPRGDYHLKPAISSENNPFHRNHYCEEQMSISLRTNPPFNRGEHSANPHLQTTTPECSDWLAAKLRDQSAKVISQKTGQGQRAAEAVKMGRNGLTMAHLVNICRADPEFRAAFFQFCGGQLEGDPALVANLSRAINAVMQGRGT